MIGLVEKGDMSDEEGAFEVSGTPESQRRRRRRPPRRPAAGGSGERAIDTSGVNLQSAPEAPDNSNTGRSRRRSRRGMTGDAASDRPGLAERAGSRRSVDDADSGEPTVGIEGDAGAAHAQGRTSDVDVPTRSRSRSHSRRRRTRPSARIPTEPAESVQDGDTSPGEAASTGPKGRARGDTAGMDEPEIDTPASQPASRRRTRRRRTPISGDAVPTASQRTGKSALPPKTKRPTKRKPQARRRPPIRLARSTKASDEFGSHWWARRWMAALEKFGWSARLERGRDYARRGNVLDLDIKPGHVSARVQGSRPWPYNVDIRLQTLNDEEWDRVISRLGRQALYAAKLLAGDMPQNIEDIFNAADVPLIPRSASGFQAECTCPDPVSPCKHIAAVHYVLSAEFDRDPFVLFELRGRTRQQIVSALQGRGADQEHIGLPLVPSDGVPAPLDESLDHFWTAAIDLNGFPVHIVPAPVPGGLLKRLGPLPVRGLPDDWRLQMFDAYRLVSRRATALGRGDEAE